MRISDWSSDVCSSDLCLPFDAEGRGVEMPLGPAIAHDHGAAVPRIARAIVVAVEEKRAAAEIARSPQPEELAEITLGRRLRFARADGTDAPAAVACAHPSDRKSTRLNSSHYCASRMP